MPIPFRIPSPSPLNPPIDLEPTVGAFFIGAIASIGLSGITTLQAWLYFLKYPQDSLALKLMVASVWILELLRSAISIHAGYYYAVKHWGSILALLQPIWSMKLMIMLTNVIELIVHGFFIHKVWRITHQRANFLCIAIAIFALGDFAMGTGAYVTASLESDYDKILYGIPEHFATAALGCAVGADWLITAALVKFFKENKSDFPRTNSLIKKLIFYAVNLGLLTSLADVVVLILANIPWTVVNFYQLAVFNVVGNLYANSFLACLNARNMVSEELGGPRTVPTHPYVTPSVVAGSETQRSVVAQSDQTTHISGPAWTCQVSAQCLPGKAEEPASDSIGKAV